MRLRGPRSALRAHQRCCGVLRRSAAARRLLALLRRRLPAHLHGRAHDLHALVPAVLLLGILLPDVPRPQLLHGANDHCRTDGVLHEAGGGPPLRRGFGTVGHRPRGRSLGPGLHARAEARRGRRPLWRRRPHVQRRQLRALAAPDEHVAALRLAAVAASAACRARARHPCMRGLSCMPGGSFDNAPLGSGAFPPLLNGVTAAAAAGLGLCGQFGQNLRPRTGTSGPARRHRCSAFTGPLQRCAWQTA
mmetsp:Transcript_109770/g.328185  ORF Transcript_109770/g.328185 Transcript_109770/m.328185 type:complete len:248 (-) Transcript_109770:13-756(-)